MSCEWNLGGVGMKHAVVIIIVLVFAVIGFLAISKKTSPAKALPQDFSKDYSNEIVAYLGCEYEIIQNAEDVSIVMEKYKPLLFRGRSEGFTPIVIVPSSIMYEVINDEDKHNDHDYRTEAIIEKSRAINVTELLNGRIADASPSEEEKDCDIMGEYSKADPVNSFASLIDYNTNRPYATIIIAKIPTTNPWELAAWIPMGGFNECPSPEEQVAVFKYWYEKYGAVPAVVSDETWELYVEKPVKTKDEAMSLALEQFGFCDDIVWQGVGKVNALAGVLVDSSVWSFWWD